MFCLLFTTVKGQDPTGKLNEAETEYAAKNLDNTRFALQGALAEINKAIGMEMLNLLPKSFGNLIANEKEDNVSNAAGIAGVFVTRKYGSENKTASIEIMGDSPMLTSLNALLSMPAIMSSSDPNQKRIKVGGYKSLLQKDSGDNKEVSYTIQVPMNTTLVTLHYKGFTDENEIIKLANS